MACYINNVLIIGANQQELLQTFQDVFELNQLKKAKWFMKHSVEYLSHSIDSQGRHKMLAKVEAI